MKAPRPGAPLPATWALLLAAAVAGTPAAAHPVEKVIQMLEGLQAKAVQQGKTEEQSYIKFEYWCKNSLKTLSKAIAAEEEAIASLTSQIESGEQEAATLQAEIGRLEAELLELSKAGLKANKERAKTNALYSQTSSDLTATITAVGQAIAALKGSKPSLLSMQSPVVRRAVALAAAATSVSAADRGRLMKLLRQAEDPVDRPELEARGDYAEHIQSYDFKSDSVIEMLKKLKMQFEEDLLAAEKEETNSVNAFVLARDAREDLVAAATKSKTEKSSTLSDVQGDLADARGDLTAQQGNLQGDSTTKDETEKVCQAKAREWEERSKVRQGELEAMKAAVEILAKVTGVRTEAPGNPVPPPAPLDAPGGEGASLLQVSSSGPRARPALLQGTDPRLKAAALLRETARTTHSGALARLAQALASHLGGPFAEVNNMIEKMIFRLMDEQKQEDEHKHWCDLELEKTNTSKVDKQDKIEELSTALEAAGARLQRLALDIKDANEMVAKLTAFMEESTEIRKVGKKENAEALKDAQEAQEAIAQATAVLEDFYKKSGMVEKEAYELLQGVELPKNPSTWDSEYTGVADPKAQPAGIIAVLQHTASEFSEMEADTRAQEATDQENYEEEMKASKIEKARRIQESEMKAAEKKSLIEKMGVLEKSKKHATGELELVLQYLKDLQPACVEGSSTYDDRKAARLQETDALRHAQDILRDAFTDTTTGAPAVAMVSARRLLPRATRFLRAHPALGAAAAA